MTGTRRTFDSILCFGGEDWWYHNRGHFDMQMMRELSATVPVLYVNSIGMRTPAASEGSMFFRRIGRKIKSLTRGLVRVRAGFTVYTPFAIPGPRGMALTRRLLRNQLKWVTRRLGMHSPLLWVACPPAVAVVEALDHLGLIYQRTDRLEEFPGVQSEQIRGYDRRLKGLADLSLFCSGTLYRKEGDECRNAAFIDHGVDFERFSAAGDEPRIPPDLAGIDGPRVGFVGGIDRHTFDPELFLEVARNLPDIRFVMVGACTLPDGWCVLPNVHFLGRKPYEDVADYMAACDVLIMPWNRNDWIQACNPIKLKEYLAVGRPVVSTPFAELESYVGYVRVARDGAEFTAAVRAALEEPRAPKGRRARVAPDSWHSRAADVLVRLEALGLEPITLKGHPNI